MGDISHERKLSAKFFFQSTQSSLFPEAPTAHFTVPFPQSVLSSNNKLNQEFSSSGTESDDSISLAGGTLPFINSNLGNVEKTESEFLFKQIVDEARSFRSLSWEERKKSTQEIESLKSKIESVQTQLTLETKVRDAAISLSHLHASNKKLVLQAEEQLHVANQKIIELSQRMYQLNGCCWEQQKAILENNNMILLKKIERMELQNKILKQKKKALEFKLDSEIRKNNHCSESALDTGDNGTFSTLKLKNPNPHSKHKETPVEPISNDSHSTSKTDGLTSQRLNRKASKDRKSLFASTQNTDNVSSTSTEAQFKLASGENFVPIQLNIAQVQIEELQFLIQEKDEQIRVLEEELSAPNYCKSCNRSDLSIAEQSAWSGPEDDRFYSREDKRVVEMHLKDAIHEKQKYKAIAKKEQLVREELQRQLGLLQAKLELMEEGRERIMTMENANEILNRKLPNEKDDHRNQREKIIIELQSELKEAIEEIEQFQLQHQETTEALCKLYHELPPIPAEKNGGHRLATDHFTLEGFVHKIEFLFEEYNILVDKILGLQAINTKVRLNLSSHQHSFTNVQEKEKLIDKLKHKLEKEVSKKEQLKTQLSNLEHQMQAEKMKLSQELDVQNKINHQKQQTITNLRNQLDQAQHFHSNKIRGSIALLQEEKRILLDEIEENQDFIANNEQTLRQYQQEKQKLTQQLTQAQQELDNINQNLHKQESQYEQVIANLLQKYHSLHDLYAELKTHVQTWARSNTLHKSINHNKLVDLKSFQDRSSSLSSGDLQLNQSCIQLQNELEAILDEAQHIAQAYTKKHRL